MHLIIFFRKLVQDMTELDVQVILWVGDIANMAEKLLNWKGHCICEDCMLVEYGMFLLQFYKFQKCLTYLTINHK